MSHQPLAFKACIIKNLLLHRKNKLKYYNFTRTSQDKCIFRKSITVTYREMTWDMITLSRGVIFVWTSIKCICRFTTYPIKYITTSNISPRAHPILKVTIT